MHTRVIDTNVTDAEGIVNAMTCDVEDYFQVSAFEGHIRREQWKDIDWRVDKNTHRILDLFAEQNIKATFFTLGCVAEAFPGLVKRIVEEGHEVASHGYQHIRVVDQTPDEFREDVTRTKKLLEDIGGQEITGYRAASYSINKTNLWALDVLQETGHKYSSSIYPIKHDLYGIPDAPRFAYYPLNDDSFREMPVTTANWMGKRWPAGGGGFFRLYPYAFSRFLLKQINCKEHQAGIFYFHPWEIDAEQPRQNGISAKTRFRHYLNLGKMEARLRRLTSDFKWDRMDKVFGIV